MAIRALFLDLGGVLLTNGWDRGSRELAAQTFGLDYKEMDERHRLNFDTYECGKMTLSQYLSRVVFYQERSFSEEEFCDFMFAQSKSFPKMIELVRKLKARHRLKVAVVSNEGRELTEYRTTKFELGGFIDFFVYSWAVQLRKPDEEMYQLALDLAQIAPAEVAYLEDRQLFVDVANSLGMNGIRHSDYASTVERLAQLGIALEG
jgi:putative hydrolase of the HAD superfamily